MKKYFWLGCTGLFLFEVMNVYFIMPLPGSQRMNSLDLAYFLYTWRWIFRALFGALILIGLFGGRWKRKWVPAIPLLLLGALSYMANFKMAADAMFKKPKELIIATAADNKVDPNRLVIGVEINGVARAYPIQFLGYHHQVQDELGGKKILVTYCTVCRTGRVFEPRLKNELLEFRLVGMDHFNAMLEDRQTKSWWRQVTGEAVTGKRKGEKLPEIMSYQTSLAKWLTLHPSSGIMQADPAFVNAYGKTVDYETGNSRKALTGTDSGSWQAKSWVIGIRSGNTKKAYDWNRLKKERMILDQIDKNLVMLVLAADNQSFFAYRINGLTNVYWQNDTIIAGSRHFRMDGKGIDTAYQLSPLPAYQEFWHSWQYFNMDEGGKRQ